MLRSSSSAARSHLHVSWFIPESLSSSGYPISTAIQFTLLMTLFLSLSSSTRTYILKNKNAKTADAAAHPLRKQKQMSPITIATDEAQAVLKISLLNASINSSSTHNGRFVTIFNVKTVVKVIIFRIFHSFLRLQVAITMELATRVRHNQTWITWRPKSL